MKISQKKFVKNIDKPNERCYLKTIDVSTPNN